jgi:hypothetical protein
LTVKEEIKYIISKIRAAVRSGDGSDDWLRGSHASTLRCLAASDILKRLPDISVSQVLNPGVVGEVAFRVRQTGGWAGR